MNPQASPDLSDGLEDFSGGFLSTTKPPRMRVDYTGHCLNAFVIMDRAGMLEKAEDIPDTTAK
ncbi:MAG: hypothetical protein WBN51_05950 [Gammaproteobacteria bacterium]